MKNNFIFIDHINLITLKNKITNIDESLWNEFNLRQKIYKPHYDTETRPLRWSLLNLRDILEEAEKGKYYDLFDGDEITQQINKKLYNFYGDGKIVRMILTKLKPNSKIEPHIDYGKSLKICHRIHIPLATNQNVIFWINGEEKNLKENEMWEIDNSKKHAVYNNSNLNRIHLIVDFLPIELKEEIKFYKKILYQ